MAADRSVSVRLKAEVAGYIAGMAQAAAATKGVATEVNKWSANNKAASQSMGRSAAVGGVALLGLAGVAVKTAADFDKAMSGVKAATHETAANMELLRAAAIKAGADTAFSAMDAADGMTALAKAGVATRDVLGGGLKGALDLAAAGQVSVGDAAETAATAMTQFGLAGSAVPHIADLLASAAGKAQGGVGDMSMALKQSGLVAAQMGLSIEDTTGTLAAFASAGLLGSDAGTSFRTMLLRMANPSSEAAALMDKLGISAYDAQGNFVGIEALSGQLQTAFVGQTQATRDAALATIFGSDAIRGANVLYTQGAKGIADWNDKVNDQGYAAKTAAIQLDNLRGDIEKFSGSLQTALINSGSGANSGLRGVTQTATGAVNAFGGLPSAVQGGTTVLAAVGGTALLAAGAFGTMAPKVRETRTSLEGMGKAGAAANRGLGFLGKLGGYGALAVTAAVAMSALQKQIDHMTGNGPADVDKLTASLVRFQQTGTVSGEVAKIFGTNTANIGKQVSDLSSNMGKLQAVLESPAGPFGGSGSQLEGFQQNLDALDSSLTGLVASGNADAAAQMFTGLAARVKAGGGSVKDFKELLPQYAAALLNASTTQDLAAGSATALAGSLDVVSPAAADAAAALTAYTDALDDTAAIDVYTANAQLAQSFHDLSKSLKDGGKVTNDERINLGGFAKDVKSTSHAVLDANIATDGQVVAQGKADAAMNRGRAHFIALAEKAGYSTGKSKELATSLGLIKSPPPINVDVNISRALAQLAALVSAIESSGASRVVAVGLSNKVTANHPRHQAAGGPIYGPGTATSDSIPAMLSDGEYVVRAAAVTKYGTGFFSAANQMRLAGGGPASRHGAATTAARTSAIVARTSGSDSVADIDAAIAAVGKLTGAYADQRAMAGMSAKERRTYRAEQRIGANEERLATRRDGAANRAEVAKTRAEEAKARAAAAAEAAASHTKMLTDNKASYEFDHMSAAAQVADLSRRISAEEVYSDTWLSLMAQREAAVTSMATEEKAAADARAAEAKVVSDAAAQAITDAINVRNEYARTTAATITSFGALGDINLAAGPNEVTGSMVGGSDVMTGSLIARSMAARVTQAREYVANMRALRAAGLNDVSMREVLGMGVVGGSAYAAALLAGGVGSVDASQAELSSIAGSFGLESSNWFNGAAIGGAITSYMTTQPPAQVGVKVFIGDQELNDIIRVEVNGQNQSLADSLVYGRSG